MCVRIIYEKKKAPSYHNNNQRKLHKLQIFPHVTAFFPSQCIPEKEDEKKIEDNSDTHVFLTYFTKCQVVSKILLLYFV